MRDHGMCTTCVATFPRSRGRPPLVPVHVAGELWPNARNRAVGVLGSSGMGWGAMVLPFLSRRSEGAALHATSVECFNTTKVQYDQWPVDEVRAAVGFISSMTTTHMEMFPFFLCFDFVFSMTFPPPICLYLFRRIC